ncbi:MAG: MFS transporter [Candidatus Pacearchaeota archaeon]|nr:MFS transporter [Candidatus Pacearchaeota archaeon]
MSLYKHFHDNIYHYFHTELSKLELSVWLHTIGNSLINMFIPIILLMSGFSLIQVIFFLFIFNLIDVPLNFTARWFTIKIGARNTIIIGMLFEIISFIILYYATFNWIILLTFAFASAVFDTFYWVAQWFIFNECVRIKKGTGKQVGFLFIVRKVGSLISPLIGALFLIFLDKRFLIFLSILFIIFSIIPLFWIKLDFMQPKIKQNFRKFFKDKENKTNFFSLLLKVIPETVESTVLPIFIFITFSSLETVGILPMITTFSSIIFTYYIGKFADKYNKTSLMLLGSLSVALIWIIRALFPQISIFYISTIFMGFVASLIDVPIDTKLVENGKKTSMLDTSTYRNTAYMFMNMIFFGILYFAIEIFKVSFIVASFSMFILSIFCTIILLRERNIKR